VIYLDHNATTPVAPEVRETMWRSLGLKTTEQEVEKTIAAVKRAVDALRG
jgi:cysteine sulfinate desulfinase/cysteine desulfurase-like protein